MARVRNSLKRFVDEQMQPNDLVAIIAVGNGAGTLQQFTSDKRQLYAAIEKLKWNARRSCRNYSICSAWTNFDEQHSPNQPRLRMKTKKYNRKRQICSLIFNSKCIQTMHLPRYFRYWNSRRDKLRG